MRKFLVSDGHGEMEIEADCWEAAAIEYVHTGEWGPSNTTRWIHVSVYVPAEDGGWDNHDGMKVTLHPDVPKCVEAEHRWIQEQTRGNGGGISTSRMCRWCGVEKTWTNWGQDPDDGEQGLESITYSEPDPNFAPVPFRTYPACLGGDLGGQKIEDGDTFEIRNADGSNWTTYRIFPSFDICGCMLQPIGADDDLPARTLLSVVTEIEESNNEWEVIYLGKTE
jgi:hypothetical protein